MFHHYSCSGRPYKNCTHKQPDCSCYWCGYLDSDVCNDDDDRDFNPNGFYDIVVTAVEKGNPYNSTRTFILRADYKIGLLRAMHFAFF